MQPGGEKLVEEHNQELTTYEPMDLHHEQQQQVIEDIWYEEEEDKKIDKSLASSEIRKMCKVWERTQNFVENHYLTKTVAV